MHLYSAISLETTMNYSRVMYFISSISRLSDFKGGNEGTFRRKRSIQNYIFLFIKNPLIIYTSKQDTYAVFEQNQPF